MTCLFTWLWGLSLSGSQSVWKKNRKVLFSTLYGGHKTRLSVSSKPPPPNIKIDWELARENADRCLLLLSTFENVCSFSFHVICAMFTQNLRMLTVCGFSSHKHWKGEHLRHIKLKLIPLLMQKKRKHARKKAIDNKKQKWKYYQRWR